VANGRADRVQSRIHLGVDARNENEATDRIADKPRLAGADWRSLRPADE
jgi:hypothetical protein